MTATRPTPPLLEMQQISKAFPGVQALKDVSLRLSRGEVLALLGENGAGKSTLIRMLGGAHLPDSGTIRMEGRSVRLDNPHSAIAAGLGVIYQEFNLIPQLTAWENIFLGREGRIGRVRRKVERRRAAELFDQIGVHVPLDQPAARLSVAQRQIVEIAKALSQDVRLLVMDEPSAALCPQEVARLFEVIRELRACGIGVIYISHRLEEVFEIADRVTVLRDGEVVGDEPVEGLTRQRMIRLMVGREIEHEYPVRSSDPGAVRLLVRDLRRRAADPGVDLEVRRGEILGVTGLVGAGRTELARLIFGADRAAQGTIRLDDRDLQIRGPRDAIRAGICLLTEDRKCQGLMLQRSVLENFGLPNLGSFSRCGILRQRDERRALAGWMQKLRIRIPGDQTPVMHLSGGNQQKVVLAKWLQRNAEVVIFDEPTRGIDVGARYEIYLLMNELSEQGKAIIMISSELTEVLGMSDRIAVMKGGAVVGVIDDAAAASQERILEMAVCS